MQSQTSCRYLAWIFVAFLAGETAVLGQATGEQVDFGRDVRPILAENCFHCHGPDAESREADLRLDQAGIVSRADGDSSAVIVAGHPERSELVGRIEADDDDVRMPPPDSNRRLTEPQKTTLREWIRQGAEYRGHWSLEPIVAPRVPRDESAAEWARNEIDRFVQRRLRQRGLEPSPEASAETLVRRLFLDLTGLPPDLDDVDRFLADPSDQAYERLVDRLLESPHAAERLALDWLDAARYADTNGYSIDDHRDMWAWRDWVIAAFRDNMPYDRFVIEQLAGDLLEDATVNQHVATGFLRNGMNTHEGGTIEEEYRVAYVVDKVDTVSTVLLGLTLKCAQCHEHKFDPFTQEDYYRFFAFFDRCDEPGKGAVNGNTKPVMRVESPLLSGDEYRRAIRSRIDTLRRLRIHPSDELVTERSRWEQQRLATLLAARADRESEPDQESKPEREPEPERESQSEREPEPERESQLMTALTTPPELRDDRQYEVINAEFRKSSRLMEQTVSSIDGEIKVLRESLESGATSVMVMNDDASDRVTRMLVRGQYDQPGEPVAPGVPESLPAMADGLPANRLGLARWIVQDDHPTTARVAVNRYWRVVLGTGIVETAEDFGVQGQSPTHPELLDWLAADFRDHGWNVRRLLKQIVMSATYRQSSDLTPRLSELDPRNRWLARAPRFRLQAEFVRDNALAIGGLLSRRIGGPSVYPPQPPGLWKEVSHFGHPTVFTAQAFYGSSGESLLRRGMYTFWKRTSPPPFLSSFDAPTRETCAVRRLSTNTPLQSLVLMNDPQHLAAAKAFGERILAQGGETLRERTAFAFRLATARHPDQREVAILVRAIERNLLAFRDEPARARLLIGSPGPADAVAGNPDQRRSDDDAATLAAYMLLAGTILNLDETITRQ